MALVRTQDQVIIDLLTNVLRASEQADVMPGQVLRDIIINAPSTTISNLYSQINQVSINQSIANANLMSTADLDNLLANFGITRNGAATAFGQVTFYTSTLPSTAIIIPAGTILGTNLSTTATEMTFTTQFDVTFNPALSGIYFNPNTGYYEILCNVIATNPGSIGNVGPFTITTFQNGNYPFSITNYNATSGGTDQESNNNFAIRALNTLLGSNVGTATGYDGTVSSQPNVIDTLVVGPGNPLMTRDGGFGGKVDIWCITSPAGITEQNASNKSACYIPNWNFADQFTKGFIYNFPALPVYAYSPITVTATVAPSGVQNVVLFESRNPAPSGTSYVNPSGIGYHYTVFLADDNQTGHSIESNDYILWNANEMQYLSTFNPSGNTMLSGNTMSVNIDYSYDQTIDNVQAVIDLPDNKIITADVLIKEAEQINLSITMNVVIAPSYQATAATLQQTIGNIQSAVAATINSTELGDTIQEANLIQAAMNTSGVTNVDVSNVQIIASRSPYYNNTQIQITNDANTLTNQYFVPNNIVINSVQIVSTTV